LKMKIPQDKEIAGQPGCLVTWRYSWENPGWLAISLSSAWLSLISRLLINVYTCICIIYINKFVFK
jgi:hypothetical protein